MSENKRITHKVRKGGRAKPKEPAKKEFKKAEDKSK